MGTNFYLRSLASPPCPTCGHAGEPQELHIGKSSAGWNFGLRIHPELSAEHRAVFGVASINELDDWKPLFELFLIFDEYGDAVTADVLLKSITERSHPNGLLSRLTAGPEHMGPYGYLRQPGELLAGKGTYDLCNYEFS